MSEHAHHTTISDVARLRLAAQLLLPGSPGPRDSLVSSVGHLAAIQCQDLQSGLLAAALRTASAGATNLAEALGAGTLARTWTMRGTLHLVAARDVRVFVGLSAERVMRGAASRHRLLEIGPEDVAVARRTAERCLAGGVGMTRRELFAQFESAGQATGGQRGIHLLAVLSHQLVLVQGPLRGRQQEFRLAEEWLPPDDGVHGDDALEALARRFLAGHGPADDQDFAWWIGQPIGRVRGPFGSVAAHLPVLAVGERRLFCDDATAALLDSPAGIGSVAALPMWDELILGYRDRSAVLPDGRLEPFVNGGVFKALITLSGRAIGTWTKGGTPARPRVVPALLTDLDAAGQQALQQAAARIEAFWTGGTGA